MNTFLEGMAKALMEATRADGTPILCGDPDFDELPRDETERGEDDDLTQEDVLMLALVASNYYAKF